MDSLHSSDYAVIRKGHQTEPLAFRQQGMKREQFPLIYSALKLLQFQRLRKRLPLAAICDIL